MLHRQAGPTRIASGEAPAPCASQATTRTADLTFGAAGVAQSVSSRTSRRVVYPALPARALIAAIARCITRARTRHTLRQIPPRHRPHRLRPRHHRVLPSLLCHPAGQSSSSTRRAWRRSTRCTTSRQLPATTHAPCAGTSTTTSPT